jgi:lipoate-protein ligase A
LETGPDYLLLYINEPSVTIGRNQKPLEETNYAYLKNNGIQLIRRISGGGAVYHDLGNINISLITAHDNTKFHNYKELAEPIIRTLGQIGISAVLKKNQILADGRKISGTAQFTNLRTIISHSNLDILSSKAVKSNKHDVTNISELLSNPMKIEHYKKMLLEGYSETHGGLNEYRLPDQAWDQIYELASTKYESWDWNYGKTPEFISQHAFRVNSSEMNLKIHVKQRKITRIESTGEKLPDEGVKEFESRLLGQPYDRHVSGFLKSFRENG